MALAPLVGGSSRSRRSLTETSLVFCVTLTGNAQRLQRRFAAIQTELDKIAEEDLRWAARHFPAAGEDALPPLRGLGLHREPACSDNW